MKLLNVIKRINLSRAVHDLGLPFIPRYVKGEEVYCTTRDGTGKPTQWIGEVESSAFSRRIFGVIPWGVAYVIKAERFDPIIKDSKILFEVDELDVTSTKINPYT